MTDASCQTRALQEPWRRHQPLLHHGSKKAGTRTRVAASTRPHRLPRVPQMIRAGRPMSSTARRDECGEPPQRLPGPEPAWRLRAPAAARIDSQPLSPASSSAVRPPRTAPVPELGVPPIDFDRESMDRCEALPLRAPTSASAWIEDRAESLPVGDTARSQLTTMQDRQLLFLLAAQTKAPSVKPSGVALRIDELSTGRSTPRCDRPRPRYDDV